MTPKTLMPMIQRRLSSVSSANRPTVRTPALLTRMLQVPCWASDLVGELGHAVGVRDVGDVDVALAPLASTACWVAASPSASTSTSASAQPRPASSSAVARPMPLPAPVTTATRSVELLHRGAGHLAVRLSLGVGLALLLVLDELAELDACRSRAWVGRPRSSSEVVWPSASAGPPSGGELKRVASRTRGSSSEYMTFCSSLHTSTGDSSGTPYQIASSGKVRAPSITRPKRST